MSTVTVRTTHRFVCSFTDMSAVTVSTTHSVVNLSLITTAKTYSSPISTGCPVPVAL